MVDPILKSHIHLGLTLGDEPENAPVYKFPTIDREEIPVFLGSIERGLAGNTMINRLKDSSGDDVDLCDFVFRVRVDARYGQTYYERKEALKAMHGRRVYFVDHEHCADGDDHTAYVRPMIAKIGRIPRDHVALAFAYVEVELMDDRIAQS